MRGNTLGEWTNGAEPVGLMMNLLCGREAAQSTLIVHYIVTTMRLTIMLFLFFPHATRGESAPLAPARYASPKSERPLEFR